MYAITGLVRNITFMKTDIIVKGFSQRLNMNGLIYDKGDNSPRLNILKRARKFETI